MVSAVSHNIKKMDQFIQMDPKAADEHDEVPVFCLRCGGGTPMVCHRCASCVPVAACEHHNGVSVDKNGVKDLNVVKGYGNGHGGQVQAAPALIIDDEPIEKKDAITIFCGGPKIDVHVARLEILCGITVALAQVPEAVAFSFVAGVDPYVGLTAAWIIGCLTALLGGRPAMISGATGAIAAVTGDLVAGYGVEYLLYAVILMGIIQIVLGSLQMARLASLISHSVMVGFCNGLGLVIGLAQFHSFKAPADSEGRRLQNAGGRRLGGAFGAFASGGWIEGETAVFSAIICAIAFLVCIFFPRLTEKFPSSLMAILLSIGIEWAIVRPIGFSTWCVEDFASVQGTLPLPVWGDPQYNMPPLDGDSIGAFAPVALVMAIIGLVESLMTLDLVDELTQSHGNRTRECLGQGIANVVCGVFGGMGGCAMIGQAMINVKSGARTRLSSFMAGLFLLIILLALYPVINAIPVAALAGVMFNVVYHTFDWASLGIMLFSVLPEGQRKKFGPVSERQIPLADAVVILLVTGLTLISNLAVAVVAGVLFRAVAFSWDTAKTVTCEIKDEVGKGGEVERKIYMVSGPIFFASAGQFLELFDVRRAAQNNVLNLENARIDDFSGIIAINTLAERFARYEKNIVLEGQLDALSSKLLNRAGKLVEIDWAEEWQKASV